jgi:hypothetical protein
VEKLAGRVVAIMENILSWLNGQPLIILPIPPGWEGQDLA